MLGRYLGPMGIDVALVVVAYFVALLLRFEGQIPSDRLHSYYVVILPIGMAYVAANYFFGLYHRVWRYASSLEVTSIIGAVGAATALLTAANFFWAGARPLPLSVPISGGIFTLAAFAGVRYRQRLITGLLWRWEAVTKGHGNRVLIVGAGEEGQLVGWRLRIQGSDYNVVGYVDDDPSKLGFNIHGAKVLGTRQEIQTLAMKHQVDTIIVAMDKVSGEDIQAIVGQCEKTRAKIKIAPNLFSFVEGAEGQPLVRDVSVEDLLARESVPLDREMCHKLLAGKVVLVTGAAGSIGSELCRQIIQFHPAFLLMLDNNETGLNDLQIELFAGGNDTAHKILVGDILRTRRMESLWATYQPQIVFHCAAYKHVPLMEEAPCEAVLVNLKGTQNLANLALEHHVERFVFISTDKAVEPVGIMGATKYLAESLVLSMPPSQGSFFTAVRFGNVLNSRGSVVPLFLKQIDKGGPVTVTSEEMTRFLMGLSEAVSLIIQAATYTQGRDVFMLNMGQPMKIADLARKLIRLRGLRVDEDIAIVYTGIRPGERLTESLVAPGEEVVPTPHPYIFRLMGRNRMGREALVERVRELILLAEAEQGEELASRLLIREP
ncbi:MAG: polysaccharide biosynthesis protein [Chloroflexi bacterium]|nr:polysaccharide biosynthesis protein [Chloroflexota bacterium]